MLPPFGWQAIVSRWQFAPIVTGPVVIAAGLYLWGARRVRQRHPARPGRAGGPAMFLGGLAVVVLATESGIGSYDDVLFWDHMVQHLMLIMVAPPLLIFGQPITLLLHASRNPLHTWAKRVVRSPVASFLTWPVFGFVAYAPRSPAAHLTSLANLAETNQTLHNAEHALFLVVGYLFFLPILGSEPIRWRLSYPVRFVILVLVMPVDTFTGIVLGYGNAGTPGVPDGPAARVGAGSGAGPALRRGDDVGRRRRDHVRADDARVPDVEPDERSEASGRGWLEAARRTSMAGLVAAPASGPRPASRRGKPRREPAARPPLTRWPAVTGPGAAASTTMSISPPTTPSWPG